MNNIISWDSVMSTSLSMPLVKVDRTEFLTAEFSVYGNSEKLIDKRPIDIYNDAIIEKAAKGTINSHLMKVTTISAVAGIPGGLTIVASIPADIAQYYWHVLVLAQKLGYIYGWPDLLDDNKQINETTKHVLTLFVGIMLGAQAANKLVSEIAKRLSKEVAKRLPQKALTKTAYYPIIKQTARWIGVKITKDSFARNTSKIIPLLGGIVSGTITAVTFKPMASKLHKELREQMKLHNSLYRDIV